ncbi:MAG: phage portal protein [Tepidisphaeraceae bacterium]
MGLLNRIFGRTQAIETRSADYLPNHLGGGFASGYNDSSVAVSESTALAASAVYACVKILAEAVAQLPVHVYQRGEGGKDYAHPVARLLAAEPNEFMTSATFRETLLLNLCLYGNAYAFIERDELGVPVGLYPLRSDCTRPIRDGGELQYQTRLGSTNVLLSPVQVLHVLNFSFDGITGISPIQQARQNIGLSLALERFAAKLFANGGNVGGVLKIPPMNEDAMKNFVSSWKSSYTGLENSFRVAVLPDGFDFKQTTIDPERGQVKDARIHQVLEVARIYRIPPHMLGVLDKASYASIEQQSMDFYMQAVQPIVTRFEQEANRKLLLEREKPTVEIKFNMDAMLRASTKERYETYAVAINNGVMTRAEARAKESLPFIAGSDALLMPLNVTTVGQQPQPAALPAPKDDGKAEAVRAMLLASVRRFIVKEAKAVQRAAGKRNTDELRAWATTFYDDHRKLVAETLAPVLAAAGLTFDAEQIAKRHCDEGVRLIESAIRQTLEADELLEDIEGRAVELTDSILNEGKNNGNQAA